VARFARLLRRHGVAAPLTGVLDAVAGLSCIDPGDGGAFYSLLRANLVSRREDLAPFRALFIQFWLSGPAPGVLEIPRTGQRKEEAEGLEPDGSETAIPRGELGTPPPYSPHPLHRKPFDLEAQLAHTAPVQEAVARMLRHLHRKRGRRFRDAPRGARISLGRLMRKNIQYGDLVFLRFRERKPRRRRVVFLCDASGSMDAHQLLLLHFMYALLRVERQTEVFFFSTELTRATALFDSQPFAEAIRDLPGVVGDWAGGTRIGHCLRSLNSGYGTTLLSARPALIVYSDGWDRGEIPLLESQMALLRRRAHRIIWLNPLLETQGYEPICMGMSAALPFVDLFLPAGSWEDLARLTRKLGEMIL
jgi:uncharacterized protein with von Willebrand factor type A (vWA) domain